MSVNLCSIYGKREVWGYFWLKFDCFLLSLVTLFVQLDNSENGKYNCSISCTFTSTWLENRISAYLKLSRASLPFLNDSPWSTPSKLCRARAFVELDGATLRREVSWFPLGKVALPFPRSPFALLACFKAFVPTLSIPMIYVISPYRQWGPLRLAVFHTLWSTTDSTRGSCRTRCVGGRRTPHTRPDSDLEQMRVWNVKPESLSALSINTDEF